MFLSGERKKNRYNRLFSIRFLQCKSLKSLSTMGTAPPMFFPLVYPQRRKKKKINFTTSFKMSQVPIFQYKNSNKMKVNGDDLDEI